MYFKVDTKIFQKFPDLNLGVLVVKGMDNLKRHTAIAQLMNGACAQQQNRFKKFSLDEDPTIKTWRDAYKNFGANPDKTPCSIEALLKRITKGQEIPKINTLVDIYNYFSIKNIVPIGGEDMDQLCGDLKLTFATGEEPFRAILSEKVKCPNEGEIIYRDSGGVTCRRWNWRECDRTKFDQKTKNAIIIMEDLGILGREKLEKLTHELAVLVQKYCGGEVEEHVLHQAKSEVDLGIAGKTGVNDGEYQGTVIVKNKKSPLFQDTRKTKPEISSDTLIRIKLESLIIEATKKAYPQKEICEAEIGYPKDTSHGDYSCNVAMSLGKEIQENPNEVAKNIIEKIQKPQYLEKIEIAGPGFVNFYLDRKWMLDKIKEIIKSGKEYGSLNIGEGRTVIIDYSSTNVAKPLGAHHLLSTIIGQSLKNIYKFLGFDCIGINHIGDWGTQFGKLIYAYKSWGEHEVIEKDPTPELLKLYVRFHEEAEEDESLEDKAREEFQKLEEGDEQNTKLWEWFRKISLNDIQKTFDFLGGIHFDHVQGEAFYNDKMAEMLQDGKKKGVFVQGEGGSWVIKYENDKYPPYLVQKSDGATLYSTRDLAAVKYRQDTWHPEKILYVVDVAQSLHFQQLFEGMDLLGTREAELVHVVFGRMQFKDKKMSTRKGNIILLDEVLDEAIKRATKIVIEKSPDLKEDEKEKSAHKIGVGALKYSVLGQNRTTNIVFDWDKILNLDGNSAPYLQYTYARANSILNKADEPVKRNQKKVVKGKEQVTLFEVIENVENGDKNGDEVDGKEPLDAEAKENALMSDLVKFSEYISIAAAEYKPNMLANYLYGLAQKFNTFYNGVPVLKSGDKKAVRLQMVEATAIVLQNGLNLLGIEIMERM